MPVLQNTLRKLAPIAVTRRGLATLAFSLLIAAVALPRPRFAGEAAAQPAAPSGADKGPVVGAGCGRGRLEGQ
jgi:molybdate transport system substrate-binding protein